MKALVVDDSRAMRRMLSRFVKDLGFEVTQAEQGEHALELLRTIDKPDLMLVDWNMPVMNGLEFVKAVRRMRQYDDSRIMMVTTESGVDRVDDALTVGANEYLMKPFTPEALRDKVSMLGFEEQAPCKPEGSTEQRPLRVLVIDDCKVVLRIVCNALAEVPGIETATAENGEIGLEKIEQWSPDAVILDVEMPVLDGLETLKRLRKKWHRLPVMMFSSLTARGAAVTLQALAMGATAYVPKPSGSDDLKSATDELRGALAEHVFALCRTETKPPPPPPAQSSRPPRTARPAAVEAIVIAASTGGPVALGKILQALPADLPVPVLIAQHMPPLFTEQLASGLNDKSRLRVAEAVDDTVVKPGEVWVARGGYHMEVRRDADAVRLVTHQGPHEQSVRPAADVLMRSVATVYGNHTLAVVLTGMGKDGLAGCEAIYAAGGQVLAQDRESSIVWGMPGSVTEAGLADEVLPLDRIAANILDRLPASAPGSARS